MASSSSGSDVTKTWYAIDAILLAVAEARESVNIFNLGADEYCTVDQAVEWICRQLALSPRRKHSGGERGWIGDSPFVFLDCARIRSLGWKPKRTIKEAVAKTLDYLQGNRHLYCTREEMRPLESGL